MPKPKSNPESHFRTEHLARDLTGRSVRGGMVTMLAQLAKMAVQFATTVILARLLLPEAFGLVAMVAVLLTFLEMFKDLGLSAATVQRPLISHAEVSALFWINVALGAITTLLMIPLAPALAWFYGEPALLNITLAFGIGFLVSGFSTQHLALLRRQMRFSLLAGIQMGAEILAMAAAVIAALAGADYWALVIQRLVWAACLSAGSWLFCGWRPGHPAPLRQVRDLLGFGSNVTGSNLANLLVRNLDQILIGWYWGATQLGYYDRAYKVLLVPVTSLNFPLFSVAMPTLSRLADQPERYRRAYLRVVEKLNMATMPAAAVLIAAPDLVVHLLFGPQWAAAAPIMAWLGLATLYQPILQTFGWLLMTQNRTAEMLRWGTICSAMTAVGVVGGLPFGAAGVATGFALSGLFIRLPCQFWVIGRRGPVTARDLYVSMLPSLLAALAVAATIWGLRHSNFWTPMDERPLAALALLALAAATVSLACFVLLPQSRHSLRDMRTLAGLAIRRRAPA
ncbi:lipopolysaccharide biosynthesis protein [Ferrovibrio sp.]|uniref:lipopolysaccharide biosynthesis protein n=1 Tax=Ferrovibrio sp. TaxID=1917215 RepID=UPI00345B945F